MREKREKIELHPELWDSHYTPKEIETLKIVAKQYGLDPLAREVIMIDGNIYVTAAGLQRLALRDPDYDGCEIELVHTDWEKNFFVVKARVWKKGCSRPFEDYGDADPTTSRLKGHALFRHAITRARARAMRSAFAIPFCTVEELDDEIRLKAISRRNFTRSVDELPANDNSSSDENPLPRGKSPSLEEPNYSDESTSSEELFSTSESTSGGEISGEFGVEESSVEGVDKFESSEGEGYNSEELKVRTLSSEKRGDTSANWDAQEQERIASDLLQRMFQAQTIEELKREWDFFNSIKDRLSPEWIERIYNIKEQRKAILKAA